MIEHSKHTPSTRRRACLAAVCLVALFQTVTAAQTRDPAKPPRIDFVNIAPKAGLTIKTEAGSEKSKKYIIETTGSGAAIFDYDGDGWPDIFLANGTTLDGSGAGTTSQLYHNNHDGTFTNVTQKAGA